MPVSVEHCPNCGAPLKLDAQLACSYCQAPINVTTPTGKPDYEAMARAVDPNVPFALMVEDIFVIRSKGIVLTGRVESGVLRAGDPVILDGPKGDITTRCSAIEMFNKAQTVAVTGMQVGLILEGVERDQVAKGSRIRSVR